MYLVQTMQGAVFPISDEVANDYLQEYAQGNSFSVAVKVEDKICAFPSHQVSIITLAAYKMQEESRLARRGEMICPHCFYPKQIGRICGTCGGNSRTEYLNLRNVAIHNLNEEYFNQNKLLK